MLCTRIYLSECTDCLLGNHLENYTKTGVNSCVKFQKSLFVSEALMRALQINNENISVVMMSQLDSVTAEMFSANKHSCSCCCHIDLQNQMEKEETGTP